MKLIRNPIRCASHPLFHRAGDGNRTHVSSLEGWCSTIELHPHRSQNAKGTLLYINIRKSMTSCHAQHRNRTSHTRIFSPLFYHLSYLCSQNRTPATLSKTLLRHNIGYSIWIPSVCQVLLQKKLKFFLLIRKVRYLRMLPVVQNQQLHHTTIALHAIRDPI